MKNAERNLLKPEALKMEQLRTQPGSDAIPVLNP